MKTVENETLGNVAGTHAASEPQRELSVKAKQATPETGTHEGRYFEPAVDIYETEHDLILTADVPGADAEEVETDLKDNLLTVTVRVKPLESKWRSIHREYEVGHYLRQFRLGQQIDQSKISAQLKDGVLTLTLPKADAVKPRRVKVTAG
jgi:HSP20 family protein